VYRVDAVARQRRRGQVDVELLEAAVRVAGLVDLGHVVADARPVEVVQTIDSLPAAEEVVEAVVLLVDDDDVVDLREVRRVAARVRARRRGTDDDRHGGQQNEGRQEQSPNHENPPRARTERNKGAILSGTRAPRAKVAAGRFALEGLEPGRWRELEPSEVKRLELVR
jgi:hypothetical protein